MYSEQESGDKTKKDRKTINYIQKDEAKKEVIKATVMYKSENKQIMVEKSKVSKLYLCNYIVIEDASQKVLDFKIRILS